jgi:hypothetical protein
MLRVGLPVLALVLAVATTARADKLAFSGTHTIRFSHNGVIKQVSASGTGVANANSKVGPLTTLVLTRPFARITQVVTATTDEIGIDRIEFNNVRIDPKRPGPHGLPGVFAPINAALAPSMSLTRSTLPAAGSIKLCNVATCMASVNLKLTQQTAMGVAIGPGVGGAFTATGMSGTKAGLTKVMVVGHPWTVNTTMVDYQTKLGGVATLASVGTAKGPQGNNGTTLDATTMLTSMGMTVMHYGTLQLVSGIQTTCAGCGGNNSPSGQITRLTINFAPEPGLLIPLCAGAAGLALLGRRRVRGNRRAN